MCCTVRCSEAATNFEERQVDATNPSPDLSALPLHPYTSSNMLFLLSSISLPCAPALAMFPWLTVTLFFSALSWLVRPSQAQT